MTNGGSLSDRLAKRSAYERQRLLILEKDIARLSKEKAQITERLTALKRERRAIMAKRQGKCPVTWYGLNDD